MDEFDADKYTMPWAKITSVYNMAQSQFLNVVLASASKVARHDLVSRLIRDPGHPLTEDLLAPSNPSRYKYVGASDAAFQVIVDEEEKNLKALTESIVPLRMCMACGKAGKVTFKCKQIRAADEPATYFFTCGGCSAKWREG